MISILPLVLAFSIESSQQNAISYLQENVQPVIQHAMEWGATAAISLTGLHGFIVVVKRFLD
ncbi:MAG: hypothetical protein ACKPH7_11055 [Planktothrix sp.]|uniref:hypothetical protein n=1 Tax=Planktothrix sp. TaxID=3088171 RepID=UPI0038D3CB45